MVFWKIEIGSNFDFIILDDFFRDCLVFGICDSKVREWLLWEVNLSFVKIDEICFVVESIMV